MVKKPDEAAANLKEQLDLYGYVDDTSDSTEAILILLEEYTATHNRPEIVCLCGPLRFMDAYRHAEYELEMMGAIVLAPSFMPGAAQHDGTTGCTPEQKVMLDELHKRKIDLADSILVISVGGYIGESTRSEILYARSKGKPVRFWDGIDTIPWGIPVPGEEG